MGSYLRILIQEGADYRIYGTFYKLVVQGVILFVSEMWVMIPRISRNLGGCHHKMSLWMVGMQPWSNAEGRW